MEIIPSPDEIANHYQQRTVDGNYDLHLHRARRDNVYAGMFECFSKLFEDGPAGKRILDIGCFTGDFLDHAAKAGMETWGLELQPEAARIASEKHDGRVLNIFMEDADAFESESFDCVAALGLIEHLADPMVLINLVNRVLKPGGLLFIQTPNTGSVIAKMMGRYWFCYAPVEHIHYFSKRNLFRLLEKWNIQPFWAKSHWKFLEVGFVIHQMQFWGNDIYRFIRHAEALIPKDILAMRLPFHGGEMLVAARKK